jgi:hypothetical protein
MLRKIGPRELAGAKGYGKLHNEKLINFLSSQKGSELNAHVREPWHATRMT